MREPGNGMLDGLGGSGRAGSALSARIAVRISLCELVALVNFASGQVGSTNILGLNAGVEGNIYWETMLCMPLMGWPVFCMFDKVVVTLGSKHHEY